VLPCPPTDSSEGAYSITKGQLTNKLQDLLQAPPY